MKVRAPLAELYFPRGIGRARLPRVVPLKSSLQTTPARRERVCACSVRSPAWICCLPRVMWEFRDESDRLCHAASRYDDDARRRALISGGVLALNKMRLDILRPLNTPKIYVYLDYIGTRAKQMKGYILGQFESYFHKHKEEQPHQEHQKIVVTSPKAKDVVITQQYVCQIHSQRHINVCALEDGYLEEIPVKEGQAVKKGDVMFKIIPILYKAKLDAELAEAKLAELELNNTERLFKQTKWSLRMRWHCSRPNWQRPRPRRSWRRPN